MHEVTEPLYFVIEEKLNSVDLTDKGIDLITGNSVWLPILFELLPDVLPADGAVRTVGRRPSAPDRK